MKGKAFIPLVLGLVVGLFAVKLVVDTVRQSQAGQKSESISIVRAKLDIGALTEITPDMLEEVTVKDPGLVPKNERIEKAKDIARRVTAKAIPAGSPVLNSMLAPEGARAGMVGRIKPGYRAVSVKIDEVAAAGYQIKPGDMVDVMVVMDVRGTGRRRETIAEVLLQRVEVAAIGQTVDETPAPSTGQRARPARSATLLVEEADAPKLHLAGSRGRLALALRGEDDMLSEQRVSASSTELLASMGLEDDDSGVPVVQPQPVAPAMLVADRSMPRETPHEVVIFRGARTGGSVERVTFESKRSSQVIGVSKQITGPPVPQRQPASSEGSDGRVPPWARTPQQDQPEHEEDIDYDNPRE